MMNTATRLAVAAVVLCAVLVGAVPPKWTSLTDRYSYDAYVADFGKVRPPAERAMREALFQRRLASVLAHNADPTQTYKQGVNRFTDWTDKEIDDLHMKGIPKAAVGFPPQRRPMEAQSVAADGGRNPASRYRRRAFDWRTVSPSVLTTVKDQGYCGSCWAHGTTEAIESANALKNGRLYVLSQQQLVSCASPDRRITIGNMTETMGGCDGYFPYNALEELQKAPFFGGMTEEWQNPYVSYWNQSFPMNNTFFVPPCMSWMHTHANPGYAQVTGFDFVKSNDPDAMEAAIVDKGPVIVLMAVYQSFMFYESGLYSSPKCEGKNGTMPPSHVVNLVGFGRDDSKNQDYWILRNSWSGFWGEDGYARMLRPSGTDWDVCGEMMMPTNYTTGGLTNWYPQKSCGMCGILMYGITPSVLRKPSN